MNGKHKIAEVQYFFQLIIGDDRHTLAMLSIYSQPHEELWNTSSGTLSVCKYSGQHVLHVVPATTIVSVVGMVPYQPFDDDGWFYLVEKIGLDVAHMAVEDEMEDA